MCACCNGSTSKPREVHRDEQERREEHMPRNKARHCWYPHIADCMPRRTSRQQVCTIYTLGLGVKTLCCTLGRSWALSSKSIATLPLPPAGATGGMHRSCTAVRAASLQAVVSRAQ
eukprot:6201297-Pleurochrysis_carterae.AAC.1